jgi:pimeloyl-ACP methyl ester carboxylesterase
VHAAAGRQVFGYTYDQRVDDLETSARRLAEALIDLNARGVRRLHLTGYSMGGWVAKAALDRMTADGSIAVFESIELTALATPWGGFQRANIVWRLRALPTRGLARAFSRAIGMPMGFEVGSRTPFVRARRAVLAPNVTFRVFEGASDEIATPRTAQERENYEAVVALAVHRVTIRGARHADMRALVSVPAILPPSPAAEPQGAGAGIDSLELIGG